MKFLLDYDFTEKEIDYFVADIPPLLLNMMIENYRLVLQNLDYLKDMGVHNYKDVFKKFYDMFLMDNSNFVNIFDKYDCNDLVVKIENNVDIVEFL